MKNSLVQTKLKLIFAGEYKTVRLHHPVYKQNSGMYRIFSFFVLFWTHIFCLIFIGVIRE